MRLVDDETTMSIPSSNSASHVLPRMAPLRRWCRALQAGKDTSVGRIFHEEQMLLRLDIDMMSREWTDENSKLFFLSQYTGEGNEILYALRTMPDGLKTKFERPPARILHNKDKEDIS